MSWKLPENLTFTQWNARPGLEEVKRRAPLQSTCVSSEWCLKKMFKFSGFSTRSVGSSRHLWLRPADRAGGRMVYLQVRGCAFAYRQNFTVINDAQLTVPPKSTARTGCCTLHFTRLNTFSSELSVVSGRSRSLSLLSSCLSRLCSG